MVTVRLRHHPGHPTLPASHPAPDCLARPAGMAPSASAATPVKATEVNNRQRSARAEFKKTVRRSDVVLRWNDGLFLPVAGVTSLEKLARESRRLSSYF